MKKSLILLVTAGLLTAIFTATFFFSYDLVFSGNSNSRPSSEKRLMLDTFTYGCFAAWFALLLYSIWIHKHAQKMKLFYWSLWAASLILVGWSSFNMIIASILHAPH